MDSLEDVMNWKGENIRNSVEKHCTGIWSVSSAVIIWNTYSAIKTALDTEE